MAHSTLLKGSLVAALCGLFVGRIAASGATATGTADIGGKHYTFSAPAECTYTATGSIYDVPAAIWHASFSSERGPLSYVSATIFQTSAGASQATVHATVGRVSYDIATVKGGTVKGVATARGERKGAGGTLTFDGRTAAGKPILLTISCSAFAAPEDNG